MHKSIMASIARQAAAMVCMQYGSGKAKQAATTTSKAVANGMEEGQYSARIGKREMRR
jgi:hypothetical protein